MWGRKPKKLKVLDAGSVELIDFMGGDLKVINSARQSYGRKKRRLEESDKKLIWMLMENQHGTPFETSVFTFHVKAPIFVVRQWQRHRMATYNEKSGRYTTMDFKLYVPEGDFVRKKKGRTFIPLNSASEEAEVISLIVDTYNQATIAYNRLLDMGIAKELARIVLPLGQYTEFNFTVNARSLMNFFAQRSHEAAMKEIQEYSKVMEMFFEQKMPETYQAFDMLGRRAP
jgi:thymidylate synthase (FAD)